MPPRNCCNSFNVVYWHIFIGILVASMTSILLVFSLIFKGHLVLSNVTVFPYSLHLLIIVFIVFHGISNAFKLFVNDFEFIFSSLY